MNMGISKIALLICMTIVLLQVSQELLAKRHRATHAPWGSFPAHCSWYTKNCCNAKNPCIKPRNAVIGDDDDDFNLRISNCPDNQPMSTAAAAYLDGPEDLEDTDDQPEPERKQLIRRQKNLLADVVACAQQFVTHILTLTVRLPVPCCRLPMFSIIPQLCGPNSGGGGGGPPRPPPVPVPDILPPGNPNYPGNYPNGPGGNGGPNYPGGPPFGPPPPPSNRPNVYLD